jgi:cell division protein FtsB
MGRFGESQKSSGGAFITGGMIAAAVLLGLSLLSNQDEVNRRAAEVERVQRDLVLLSEEIKHLTDQERTRASTLLEQESLARERLEWTAPGEFIIKIKEP